MGNQFEAHLAGRIATEPSLHGGKSGKMYTRFRLAVDDRALNTESGEWEKTQTVFHDVVVFGKLAERCRDTLSVGDPIIAQGEVRLQPRNDGGPDARFVANAIGPDIRLTDVKIERRWRDENSTGRAADPPALGHPDAERGVEANRSQDHTLDR